jgi:hypothetical protein
MYWGGVFGLWSGPGLTGEPVTVLRLARRVVRVRARMVAVVPRDVELELLRIEEVVLGKQGLYIFHFERTEQRMRGRVVCGQPVECRLDSLVEDYVFPIFSAFVERLG